MSRNLRIRGDRLIDRLKRLGEMGALPGGGVCRLALTEADKAGRDLLKGWMDSLGLAVTVDAIGNMVAIRPGREDGPPVMIGSHIDSVATGGLYDGALGVLAGLALVETLNEAGVETRRPIAVAAFTNEEGARFQPDMMGSMVHQGHLPLCEALASVGIDGDSVGAALDRIGYRGEAPCPAPAPACYVELHIEQGPVLEREGVQIGAVTGVQGISWTEVTVEGISNHAGTTPMAMRRDAGYVAARIAVFVRQIALEAGGSQVGTVGAIALEPSLVNVVARRAVLTVDLRNTDETALKAAERRLAAELDRLAGEEQVKISTRRLARFLPTDFDPAMVDLVAAEAEALGLSVRRMPSGAGHDAQAFAPNCPTAMIFVPSRGGISHNIEEHTDADQLEAGANVLLRVVLERAGAA